MAAGYRSYAFSWFTGYASDTASPTPGCPCPAWTVEQTLVNAFRNPDDVSGNVFLTEQTLVNAFDNPNEVSCNAYTKPATLANAWQRKACE
jgi:hypothetical protein